MSTFSDSLIDRIYDLRKAMLELTYIEPAGKSATLAAQALAADEKARDKAALALSVHATDVAERALIGLQGGPHD